MIGVMPRGFGFPREAELWLRAKDDLPELPIAASVDLRTLRDSRYLGVVGRLAEGASLAGAQAEMDHVAAALARAYPDANSGQGARVEPLFEALRGGARPAFLLLLCAAACVLLIACANVANLLLARTAGRGQELAVRAALGAGRARLARQLVTEALVVAALGCGGGLALAWASRPLMTALWPASLPPLEGLRLSGTVLALSVLLALACVVLVSLVPAGIAARADALAGLRGSGRAPMGGPGARRVRGLIVVAEVAIAVVLVNGAGLLLGTLGRLQQAPLGFAAEGALTARLDLPRGLSQDAVALRGFAASLEQRLRALPGVTAAAVGQALPLTGLRTSAGLRVEGREVEPNARLDTCWRLVSHEWHAALGVPLLRGRGFEAGDSRTAPAVALVERVAGTAGVPRPGPDRAPDRDRSRRPRGTWVTIVGVVADTPQENVAKATRPELYRPLAQDVRMGPSGLSLVVRASGDPMALAAAVRREVAAVRSDVAVSRVAPLAGLARDMLAAPRAASRVLLLFAGLALVLAALGLYGVVSCLVGETTPELGLRLALGAQPASLVALVLRRSLALAGLGLAVGLAAALALGRLLEGLLFGISPRDPLTLGARHGRFAVGRGGRGLRARSPCLPARPCAGAASRLTASPGQSAAQRTALGAAAVPVRSSPAATALCDSAWRRSRRSGGSSRAPRATRSITWGFSNGKIGRRARVRSYSRTRSASVRLSLSRSWRCSARSSSASSGVSADRPRSADSRAIRNTSPGSATPVGLRANTSSIVSGASSGRCEVASASARSCCCLRSRDSTWRSIWVKTVWPSSAVLGSQVSRSSTA